MQHKSQASAPPPAQSPRRLPPVSLTGFDSPIGCPQNSVLLTPFGGSCFHTRRSGLHRLQGLRMPAISCARLLWFVPPRTTVMPGKVRRICDDHMILITISTRWREAGFGSCGSASPTATNCVADGGAHEYDPSRQASQMRRKTRMRTAMFDRRNPVRESGARPLFRLPKGAGVSLKHLI